MPDSWQEVEGAVPLTEKPVQFNRLKISAGVEYVAMETKSLLSPMQIYRESAGTPLASMVVRLFTDSVTRG